MPTASATQASATIFLVMRRMRAPLIVLIVIFAVSTLGLTLIPGQDAEGRPWRMGFFDAFYVMSYTASTIGFGEIPYAFTYNQRMWVTISIYLTVVGWAYAIGSLLALVQERSFRQALALQHFTRKVRRLGEPFLLIAGYGQTGELLARSLDALGRRFVVIDSDAGRIDDLYLDSYHADVPGLVGDAGDPGHLAVAGLGHPYCEGVLAITDNDEANLAVTQAAALLRPDLPVITRTVSPAMAARMSAFGSPTVVNPFDRFGDHLRLALRAPASYQLLTWLESGPGEPLPKRGEPAVGRPLDRVRLRPVRPGGDPRPARRGVRRHDRRSGRLRPTIPTRSSAAATSRTCSPRPGSSGPPASSPAPTTTPRTCRWSPPRTAPTRRCSSPPGRTSRPARRCSPPSTSTRCSCPPRSSRTRCTRSCRRRCSGGSSGRCPAGGTTGPTASWAG